MTPTIVIDRRFHGPEHSANGGYTCGRVAEYLDGPARVRLRVPPPLGVPLDVDSSGDLVRVRRQGRLIAEAWPASGSPPPLPRAPSPAAAQRASRRYTGFTSHRYSTCFVCGVDRDVGDGLRVFAGPLGTVVDSPGPRRGGPSSEQVACTWTPDAGLAAGGRMVDPVFVWSVLDCPGGFSFPHPQAGTILLGELSVWLLGPVPAGERHVIVGWEIEKDGRKHHTGTALFSESGTCRGVGRGTWLEVPEPAHA
jgi:hypothetical protein